MISATRCSLRSCRRSLFAVRARQPLSGRIGLNHQCVNTNLIIGQKQHNLSSIHTLSDNCSKDKNELNFLGVRKFSSETTGEDCYNRAMEAIRTREKIDQEKQEQQAKEQYEAMEQSLQKQQQTEKRTKIDPSKEAGSVIIEKTSAATKQNNKNTHRAANIEVVRTISRQTRANDKRNRTNHDSDDNTPNQNLEEEAQKFMQYAAFRYGHKDALVRLGNEALEESKEGATKEQSDIYPHITNGDETIVNMEDIRALPSTVDRAMKLYEIAGERGSKEGWYNLGHFLWESAQSVSTTNSNDNVQLDTNSSKDYSQSDPLLKSLVAFRKSMELGDADAAYFLGVQYITAPEHDLSHLFLQVEKGKYTKIEALQKYGLDCIKQAAEDHGHSGALYYLALLMRNGDETLGIDPCPIEQFPTYLDQAADCGDSDALYLRAHNLFFGEDGYVKNYKAALDGFIQSGQAGNEDGYISAGAMLHKGGFDGLVKRDQRRAFELYQEAAEMGSKEGWRNVVACYALGEGVPKCEQTAKYIVKTMLNDEK